VAIGSALVLDAEWFRIPERAIEQVRVDDEMKRLRQALSAASEAVRQQQQTVNDRLGRQYGAVFGTHALLLEDPALAREIEALIRDQHFAAEYAVSRVIRRFARTLQNFDTGHLHTRTADLFDVERAVLEKLLGQRREQLRNLQEPVIILAHDLTPSETASLDRRMVHALATEAGGRASHTAIMAAGLEIPAVVGLGKFLTDVSGGDTVIVDGNRGVFILDPDSETRERYERLRAHFLAYEDQLAGLRHLPSETRDGVPIQLLSNIEFPLESAQSLSRGAAGIGLYRTEFLYLGRDTDPSEQEHLDAYLTVIRNMGADKPVVIRTLDLGADKFAPQAETVPRERNPFLGLRSIRLCLRNLTLFKTQMRAILRASALGKVRIMFPMVSTLLELRQCKMILAEVKEDLEEEGVAFDPDLPVGTMIEIPSAALMADQLAKEVKFFSIGTNDLTQYTLAADRTNELVAALYTPADPAVLRLIKRVVRAAQRHQIEVNVCGEMSGEPIYTMLLLGLGLRQLSVTPHNIPAIKTVIRTITLEEANQVAHEALRLETARDVNNYLRQQMRRILPEVGG
jgi:phosphotransferase system enzyme I (PtsI)